MAVGRKTGGRKAGTPNKVTAAAKDVISGAAEQLGGMGRLVAWAKEDKANERIFWGTIYPKMLPLTLAGDPEKPLSVTITRRVIADRS